MTTAGSSRVGIELERPNASVVLCKVVMVKSLYRELDMLTLFPLLCAATFIYVILPVKINLENSTYILSRRIQKFHINIVFGHQLSNIPWTVTDTNDVNLATSH